METFTQPVGIFAPPASMLLLPEIGDLRALPALLNGDLKAEVPAAWAFFLAAASGDVKRAVDLYPDDAHPLSRYNRFVLNPNQEYYQEVRQQLDGDLRTLLDVAAFCSGVVDAIEDDFDLEHELLGIALAASAAKDIESGNQSAASAKLKQAIAAAQPRSPLFAATLLGQHGDLMVDTPGFAPALAIQQYREAIRLAGDSQLPLFVAELHMKLGMLLQNAANGQRGALLEAINSYQSALHGGVTQQDHPELFAQLQNNLGLAYLSMPAIESSSQLRTGIAIQSFRHALQVYTRERNADMWASVSMNLANALQYAPSSHPQENLIQAVEIFEEVLQVRSRAKDPVAYALVLLNQANALAHLGIFQPALTKLSEAYKLFHWYDQYEQAQAARELVDQINQQMGGQGSPLETNTESPQPRGAATIQAPTTTTPAD